MTCLAGSVKLSGVSLPHHSVAARRCSGLAAVSPAIDCCTAGAQRQMRAVSRCGLTREAEHRLVLVGLFELRNWLRERRDRRLTPANSRYDFRAVDKLSIGLPLVVEASRQWLDGLSAQVPAHAPCVTMTTMFAGRSRGRRLGLLSPAVVPRS